MIPTWGDFTQRLVGVPPIRTFRSESLLVESLSTRFANGFAATLI